MTVKQFNFVLKIGVLAFLCWSLESCHQAMEREEYPVSSVDVTEAYDAYGKKTDDAISSPIPAAIKMPKDLKIIKSATI